MTLFGPSRAEVWRQLSEQIGAKYVERRWKGDRVEGRHGEWTVTLDTYTVSTGKSHVTFTRVRAPFVNPSGFRFTISRKNMFTGVAKLFGLDDVQIGIEPFDSDYVVKGTDEGLLRALLSDATMRRLMDAQKKIHLTVKDDEGWFGASFPEGVDELYFAVQGVIKDVDQLKLLYELFAATLDRLVEIGSARRSEPQVSV